MPGKRLGGAAVIFDAQGSVLLVKHNYGRFNWELPGGNAEPHESIMATALREVREETALEVRIKHCTGIYYEPDNDMHHFVFLCEVLDPTALPMAAENEIAACAFWPITALPRPINDFTIRRILDAAQGKQQPVPMMIGPREWLE